MRFLCAGGPRLDKISSFAWFGICLEVPPNLSDGKMKTLDSLCEAQYHWLQPRSHQASSQLCNDLSSGKDYSHRIGKNKSFPIFHESGL